MDEYKPKRLEDYTEEELASLSEADLQAVVEVELLGVRYHSSIPPALPIPSYSKGEFLEISNGDTKLIFVGDSIQFEKLKDVLYNMKVIDGTMYVPPIPEAVYKTPVPIQVRTVELVPYYAAQSAISRITEFTARQKERESLHMQSLSRDSIEKATLNVSNEVFTKAYAARESVRRRAEMARLLKVFIERLGNTEAAIEHLRNRFVLDKADWDYILKYNEIQLPTEQPEEAK